MLLISVLGLLVGLRYAKKMFNDYTDTKPVPLPELQMSQAEIDQVRQRVDAFRQAVRAKNATPALTLSADDINALIATDPDLQPVKGKLYVMIEGDQLKGQVSVPMEQVGLPIFRGRYLNGTGTFRVLVRNGILRLTAEKLVVKGKPLPDNYMKEIRQQNLARDINNNPRATVALDAIKEVQVKDGRLIIVPKENQ